MNYYYLIILVYAWFFAGAQSVVAQENVLPTHEYYTEEYIAKIYIEEPKRALQLLDEAENLNCMPSNMINDLRSRTYRNMYMNKSAFVYARKAYVIDSIQGTDPSHLLEMTIDLAEISFLLSRFEQSVKYATEGIALARKNGNKGSEAKLLFCLGENKKVLGLKREGYAYFDQAIDLIKGESDMLSMQILSYFYGLKMNYLLSDGCFDEVLFIGLEREKLIHEMADSRKYLDSYIDLQYSYVYIKLAYVAFKLRKYEEADNYFRKYSSTKAALTPDGKCDAAPYLLLTKRYKEVLEKCEDFKNVLRSQDTLNQQYLSVLQKEVAAYSGLNNFKKVAELRESILNIVTHMYRDEVRNAALELDAVYKVNERDKQIAKQDFRLKMHGIFLLFAIGFILLMSFFLWKSWKYNRIIRSKNKVLVRLINEQLSPKENTDVVSESLPAANREEDILSENGMEWAENRELFSKLNETILHEKLYLSPNLSRDDLVRIVHLNYARFARMIKENTGGNLSGYINNLRLNHAIQLLNEHPNYTMKAIAEDSGFNSMPTFNNLFKKKTGMTPFEFKSAQKE